MEIEVTKNILPDLLASSALITLAIYHLMIFWGRRKDADERYNLYFAFFVMSAALLLISRFFQAPGILSSFKPTFIKAINIEMFAVWCLFFSGIKFFNLLLKVQDKFKSYFHFLMITTSLNFLATFTANLISLPFYFTYVIWPLLIIVALNITVVYLVYGTWIFKEKLYQNNFVLLIFFGFVLITINLFIYRAIEISHGSMILLPNHYFTAIMLYIFAYALSVKFNKEYAELKELKESLERKVGERTDDWMKANYKLEQKNQEIEKQKTEITLINEQLQLRAEELKELDSIKSRFFTNISHEFRTPLTLIIGPLETWIQKSKDTELKSDYQRMLKQASRLLSLINQLLELSKLQKNMLKLQLSFDSIKDYVRTLVGAYSSFAKELNIELIFLDELEEQRIWFDKDKLEKIITNLITNALKFTQGGGKIEVLVRWSENNEWIEILIRDTGIGINQELLPHIFDPFYQVHFLDHQPFGGSGIGLALVKELLQLHKGKIEVNSIPGKGSAFIASLPINEKVYEKEDFLIATADFVLQEVKAEVEIKEVAIPIIGTKKEKGLLLLVDDNTDMRYYIRTHMEQNYRVIEAGDGSEGVKKAMEMIPDIVIADVMMPHMNGLEMTSFLKNNELTSHIPVLLLTAKASASSVMDGLETNADDYVTKPFNMNELRLRVRNLVNNRQTLRERYSKNSWMNPGKVESLSIDEEFLKKALLVVERNMDEPDFDMLQFSQALGMSRTQIHRKLTALTGVSATGFIRTIRLKRAAQLLKQRSGSVSEIAYQTGFISLSYFTKSFKELYGQMPSEYMG